MTSFNRVLIGPTEVSKLGDWYSYWLPNTPDDGDYNQVTSVTRGSMPTNSRHRRSSDGRYREGGNWLMTRYDKTWRCNSVVSVYANAGTRLAYRGRFNTINQDSYEGAVNPTPTVESVTANTLSFGAQARTALRPDKPIFDLSLNVLEMKDYSSLLKLRTWKLKERVKKEQLRLAKKSPPGKARWWLSKAGETYLSVSFGIVPLISAIRDFADATIKENERITQILRDAGRPVRRRVVLRNISTQTYFNEVSNPSQIHYGTMGPLLITGCYAPGTGFTHRQWVERKVWVSGQSRYYLPPGPRTPEWFGEIRSRLYGAKISASTLYNLIPWTWLIDYFTGLGHFVEACDPEGIGDNWIIDYAYIMDHTKWSNELTTFEHVRGQGNVPIKVSASELRHEHFKVRQSASIFGWGLSQGELSPKQTYILAALGASRL